MKQRLAELISYMDESRRRLLETLASINPSVAGIKPRSHVWSVEDNAAHLAAVEEGVSRLIAKSVASARENSVIGNGPDESMMTSLDRFELADGTFKRESPSGVAPPAGKSIEESVAALKASREHLREALVSSDGLDLSGTKRAHPVMGEIDMYQWALFVAQHEERHRRQIEKTADAVTELAAESLPIV